MFILLYKLLGLCIHDWRPLAGVYWGHEPVYECKRCHRGITEANLKGGR